MSELDHPDAAVMSTAQASRSNHQRTQTDCEQLSLEADAKGSLGEVDPTEANLDASPTQSLGSQPGYKPDKGTHEEENEPPSEATPGVQSGSDDLGSPASSRWSTDFIVNGSRTQTSNELVDLVPESTASPDEDGFEKSVYGDQGGGVAFDELIDRLLSQATSKVDTKFVTTFLCLYRQFSAPFALLCAIISRFEQVNLAINPPAVRLTTQLRYLSVLATWVSEYPGDFAHPRTRVKMAEFISALEGQRQFSMAIKDISLHLDIVSEDDDTYWACSDATESMTDITETHQTRFLAQNVSPTTPGDAESGVAADDVCFDGKISRARKRDSGTPSTTSSAGESSSRFLHAPLKAMESAQQHVGLTVASPRASLSKVHWHFFMDLPDEEVARELTRIDWALFSTIRPRDLIRHVSLSEEEKAKCKNLQHVKRAIDQFNHTAFWIANIILLRDKPKHRAKALEKCMSVAWKLRQLNNYNALGAVIAGINGTAVHRLSQTRELVPHNIQKQFMRLEILMGTQKSHFPYRLAWSNTTSERIPFLPLHCRDLASAGEGNLTYIGDERVRVNWKKFEVLGEIIGSIQRSQSGPYTSVVRNEGLQRLIQDVRFIKDED
ncbi:MAG: hypothetical protein Q9207_008269, partial [Kuettlingeria erythrocarpa]